MTTIAAGTLRSRVEGLLASPAVRSPLSNQGIEIVEVSAPKQTPTVQRWKVGLAHAGSPVRSKIEFSRRDAAAESVVGSVSATVTTAHGIPPFVAAHYGLARAVAQKIEALAGRAEPQARDVFDLHLLLARSELPALEREIIGRAAERTLEIDFDAYQAGVVAFLDDAQADPWRSREAWEAIQQHVFERLSR